MDEIWSELGALHTLQAGFVSWVRPKPNSMKDHIIVWWTVHQKLLIIFDQQLNWTFFFLPGANTRVKTGCVYRVRTCSVAVLWTGICSSIFVKLIILWPSVSGIHDAPFYLCPLRDPNYLVLLCSFTHSVKQWSVSMVLLLWCLFGCSSYSAIATCSWSGLYIEIWWTSTSCSKLKPEGSSRIWPGFIIYISCSFGENQYFHALNLDLFSFYITFGLAVLYFCVFEVLPCEILCLMFEYHTILDGESDFFYWEYNL